MKEANSLKEYVLFSTWLHDNYDSIEDYKREYHLNNCGDYAFEECECASRPESIWYDWIHEDIQMSHDSFWNDLESFMKAQNVSTWVLTGYLGLWNGKPEAYKQIDKAEDLKVHVWGNSIDEIKVIQKGTRIIFYMYHHDGTSVMELRCVNTKGDKILNNNLYSPLESFSDEGQKFICNYTKNFGNFQKEMWGAA